MSSADKILIGSETRTDFLGDYVAYTFGDGHVETDPPDRPVTREDYQRKRALQLARRNAAQAMVSARIASATGRDHLNRDQRLATRAAGVLDEVRQTLKVLTTMVRATTASPDTLETLRSEIDVGGQLIRPGTPEAIPLVTDTSLRELR